MLALWCAEWHRDKFVADVFRFFLPLSVRACCLFTCHSEDGQYQNAVSLNYSRVLSVGIAQSVYWLKEQWIGVRFPGRQDSLPFSRAPPQASSDATESPLFETRPACEDDLHLIPRLGLRGTVPPPTIHLHGMMPN